MAKHFVPKGPQNTADPRPVHPAHNATDRWALVVGVSDYEHAHKGISNLRFAHRDAEEIAAKLKTPSCGSFPEQNVRLLTNQDATLAQVQRSLRSFLAEPKEEDLVILYFSCHGAPDPRRPEQRYFFTYDTDPGDIAGTALPMHEIQTCISRTLRAKWVVVIADACHSGALTSTKAGGADAEVQNQFMQSLKASKESLAWLTSSQANQVSFEHQEFGNGVFTHYLLRGLEGEADGFPDGNKDGMVTIQELFQYVHEKVKEQLGETAAEPQVANLFFTISNNAPDTLYFCPMYMSQRFGVYPNLFDGTGSSLSLDPGKSKEQQMEFGLESFITDFNQPFEKGLFRLFVATEAFNLAGMKQKDLPAPERAAKRGEGTRGPLMDIAKNSKRADWIIVDYPVRILNPAYSKPD